MKIHRSAYRTVLLLLIPWMTFASLAQDPQWEWAVSIGESARQVAKQVAVDPATQHVYVVGDWEGNLASIFPPDGTKPSTFFDATYGLMDGFIAKFDQDGNPVWAFKVGGENNDQVNSIAVDQAGNIYITGMMGEGSSIYFSGTSPHTGSSTLSNASGEDFFLAKYNSDGEFIWVRRSDTDSGDLSGQDLALTADAVFAVGNASGLASFGSIVMVTMHTGQDVFLIKYSLDGNALWIAESGSNGSDQASGVEADDTQVFFIGHFDGSNFGIRDASGLTIASEGNMRNNFSDIILVSYDHAGAYAWSRTIASDDHDEAYGITQDADSLYITGAIENNADFPGYGGNPLSTSAEKDIFLASLAKTDGTSGWVQVLPSSNSGDEFGRSVDMDAFGNLYMTGDFSSDLQFPQGVTLSSYGLEDVFVAAYTAYGDFRWAQPAGSSLTDKGYGISSGPGGSIYIAGQHDGLMNLGSLVLMDNPDANGYLAKLQDTIPPLPVADPGPYGDVCGSTLGLQAIPSSGLGEWSQLSGPGNATFTPSQNDPTVSVEVDQFGSYTFAWTETNLAGSDDSVFSVEFFEPTLANAGAGGDICSLDFGLNAIPSVGYGQWSLLAGPGTVSFLPSDTIPDATASVSLAGTYTFQWTESNVLCVSAASVTVNYQTPLPVDPGTGGMICGLTFTLNAVPSFGTGSWSLQAGPGTATFSPSMDVADAVVTVSVSGDYVFQWTESDGICSSDSAINVTFMDIPLANAGAGGDICGSDFQLAAVPGIGTGNWTITGGPGTASFNPSADDPAATVVVDMPGSYTFTWTESNGICTDQDSVIVNFLDNLVVDAGADATVCGLQHDLNANPTDIPGSWMAVYGPGNAIFSPSDTDPAARVTVDAYGDYLFKWIAGQGFCSGEDSVLISFHRAPVANAGPDQVLDYRFTTYLAAELLSADVADMNASGTWTLVSGSGLIANPADPATRVTELQVGANVFEWTISSAYCPDVSDQVLITVNDVESYTLITPNNDGFNDFLVFPGVEELRGCEILIYNRWGLEVYRNADYQNDWDGRDQNDRELIPDTYYYILRIPPDRIIKSFVEIRRGQ